MYVINYSKSATADMFSNTQEIFSKVDFKRSMIPSKKVMSFSHHSLLFEIDSNSGYEFGVEGTVCILIEKTCFADAGISERQKLHQIVVIHSVVNASVEDSAMVPEKIVNKTYRINDPDGW